MSITAEQRAELERRGWRQHALYGPYDVWRKDPNDSWGWAKVEMLPNGRMDVRGDLGSVLEFAAILGIHPPGYRLVPEEVVQATRTALTYAINDAKAHAVEAVDDFDREGWEHHAGLLRRLAVALSPKKEESAHE